MYNLHMTDFDSMIFHQLPSVWNDSAQLLNLPDIFLVSPALARRQRHSQIHWSDPCSSVRQDALPWVCLVPRLFIEEAWPFPSLTKCTALKHLKGYFPGSYQILQLLLKALLSHSRDCCVNHFKYSVRRTALHKGVEWATWIFFSSPALSGDFCKDTKDSLSEKYLLRLFRAYFPEPQTFYSTA